MFNNQINPIPEPPLDPPEAKVVFYCDDCDREICEGDAYYRIMDFVFCESCVENARRYAGVDYDCF